MIIPPIIGVAAMTASSWTPQAMKKGNWYMMDIPCLLPHSYHEFLSQPVTELMIMACLQTFPANFGI